MSIRRIGTGESGPGGQSLPFARAVEADGWLHVSGQVPMVNGVIVDGGIVPQAHQAIRNLLAILTEAGYGVDDVVRVGVWLDDPRDFWAFNKVYAGYFRRGAARTCVRPGVDDGRLQGRDRLRRVAIGRPKVKPYVRPISSSLWIPSASMKRDTML